MKPIGDQIAPENNYLSLDDLCTDDVEVRSALSRVLESDPFKRSPKLREFLEYLVVETLEGRKSLIKGVSIAQDVFERTDLDDAKSSTVVSVEARRLRRQLEEFYSGEGRLEPVQIEVPKGTYVPRFRRRPEESQRPEGARATDPGKESKNRFVARLKWAALPLLLAGTIAIIAGFTLTSSNNGAASKPVVVVLPFDNLTGDASLDIVALGFSGDITTDLAELSEIDVIAFSSVSLLPVDSVSQDGAISAFEATHAVFGTVRGTAPTYRMSVELVEFGSDKIIWAGRFDHELDDPLRTQHLIAREVANALPVKIPTAFLSQDRTRSDVSPDTLALYEQALDVVNPPSDLDRLALASAMFSKVIEADPNFAGGHAGLAYVEAFQALFHSGDGRSATALPASDHAQTALDLDPNHPLALDALAFAFLVSGDHDAAIETSRRAVEANPNAPYATVYHGFLLAADGDPERGIPYIERALQLDPLEPRTPYMNILGTVLFQAGEYDDAIAAFLKNQARGGPNGPGPRATLAAAYVAVGKADLASNVMATLPEGFTGSWKDWRRRVFRKESDANLASELLQKVP